jgi:hypothetical protein
MVVCVPVCCLSVVSVSGFRVRVWVSEVLVFEV